MTSQQQWVYYFSDEMPEGLGDPVEILGGKGYSLKRMLGAGLPVPPGFTISTRACEAYYSQGKKWPEELEAQVRAGLARLENETRQSFGEGRDPLLLSLRSGASVSMPGMMDTILHVGLHPGLPDAADEGSSPFWEVYARFVGSFSRAVYGLNKEVFDLLGNQPGRGEVEACLKEIEKKSGEAFPTHPWDILVRSINAVLESWSSQRAITYRARKGLDKVSGTAVTVQAMFPSEVSGVAFTSDPTSETSDRIIIESAYGLGESIVSGSVTPDRFVVNRSDLDDINTTIGHKTSIIPAAGTSPVQDPDTSSLKPRQVRSLSALCLRVEELFGHPVDVEWAFADGHFCLLQARKIRGSAHDGEEEAVRQKTIQAVRDKAGGRRHVWVLHNLAETLPLPTPFTWDVVRQFMSGAGGFGQLYRQLGYRPSRQVCEEGFLDLLGGRIYADPERLAGLFWDGLPLKYEIDAIVADKRILANAPTRLDIDRADGRFLLTLPQNLFSMFRCSRIISRASRESRDKFEKKTLPPYLDYVEMKREQDLSACTDKQLIAEIEERCHRVLNQFGPESLRPGFFGSMAFDSLTNTLCRLLGRQAGETLAGELAGALEGDITLTQDKMLYDVACGKISKKEFVDKFGHRCVGEMELSEPRWREDPSYVDQLLSRPATAAGAETDPEEIHKRSRERRDAAIASLPGRLELCGGSSFLEAINTDLEIARALLPYRESGRHYLMLGYELIRIAAEALASRWELGKRFYFLRLSELREFNANREKFLETMSEREHERQIYQRIEMPDLIDSDDLAALGRRKEITSSSAREGVPIASGVGTGRAQVVNDPANVGQLGTNYVLVCRSTDPGWTPLFVNARALIVERGGVLSHGAIVARDFGIPAVVCPDATRIFKTGQIIRVDGSRGIVEVEEGAD